jgi:hypothetical protein
MWHSRAADAIAVTVLATAVTMVIGASVLRAPTERLFGQPIVGRHYDPFAVMTQMTAPATAALYLQPLTDVPAALASRVIGPVAAFNAIILVSFPLSALMAFLLARHLGLSRIAAATAAMAYAFSPFHIAHAAYHAHVAQTQWLPMYLLALLRCLDRATPKTTAFLVASALAVTLSNYYAGGIAAVMTPFVVAGHWWSNQHTRATRSAAIALAVLGVSAVSVGAYAVYAAQRIATDPAELAYQRSDLFRYGAKWWSYLVPPVEHPWFGTAARHVWENAGVSDGLLEQQITLGSGVAILALIGVSGWWQNDRSRPAAYVPMLALVAIVAFAFSLAPERGAGLTIRPAAWLYEIAPMFRSYARFGVLVQLAAVLLAGIGIDRLRRAGTIPARVVCCGMILLAIAEYAVRPSAMSYDVLPTAAHRAVMAIKHARVLDCEPMTRESESVGWLTGGHVTAVGAAIDSCEDPGLPPVLAAHGFTHLIERLPFDDSRSARGGLALVTRFDDARLYAVTATHPAIYTAATTGFLPRERDTSWSWRPISGDGMWIVVNTSGIPLQTVLRLELSAFHRARDLEINLDGQCVQAVRVRPGRQVYEVNIRLAPGSHELVFHPVDAPNAGLTFAVGVASWGIGEQ